MESRVLSSRDDFSEKRELQSSSLLLLLSLIELTLDRLHLFSSAAVVAPVSFIKDPAPSFDFCHNPSVIPYHGSYSRNVVRTPKLHPEFVLSKIAGSPQILSAFDPFFLGSRFPSSLSLSVFLKWLPWSPSKIRRAALPVGRRRPSIR